MARAVRIEDGLSVAWGNAATGPARKSAEIARFPKARLPVTVEDFGAACSRLVRLTFPGPSQHAMACDAARHLGCSPDTIERILSRSTAHPDLRLMFACLAIYQSRTGNGFPIGGGFEVRITQGGGA